MNDAKRDWLLAAVLVAVCVAGRAIEHDPNATPVAAAALFAGFAIRRRLLAVAVPLAAMTLADSFFHGGYEPWVMVTVYGSLTLPVLLRPWLRERWLPLRVAGCSLLASSVFFLTTNFAVWATGWGYASTLEGLLACYASAVPFFRNTLAGDLVWSGAFFGAWTLVTMRSRFKATHGAGPVGLGTASAVNVG